MTPTDANRARKLFASVSCDSSIARFLRLDLAAVAKLRRAGR